MCWDVKRHRPDTGKDAWSFCPTIRVTARATNTGGFKRFLGPTGVMDSCVITRPSQLHVLSISSASKWAGLSWVTIPLSTTANQVSSSLECIINSLNLRVKLCAKCVIGGRASAAGAGGRGYHGCHHVKHRKEFTSKCCHPSSIWSAQHKKRQTGGEECFLHQM